MSTQISEYRFRLSLGDEVIPFKSATGLDMVSETIEYKDGMGGPNQMPGKKVPPTIALRQGIFRGQTGFYDWMSSGAAVKKDTAIYLISASEDNVYMTWNLFDAFSTCLNAPGLDAQSEEATIDELCLTASSIIVTPSA
ncbi:hypothetical protein DFQ26_008895 [Actinomortierella ambigua]|nr:hypothetical protein DFQ26_008895 [Actinomortierella ambigua]